MKLFVAASLVIAAAISLNILATHRDAQLLQTAAAYEQCVQAEYGMTPIAWYEQHQKYPVCGNGQAGRSCSPQDYPLQSTRMSDQLEQELTTVRQAAAAERFEEEHYGADLMKSLKL